MVNMNVNSYRDGLAGYIKFVCNVIDIRIDSVCETALDRRTKFIWSGHCFSKICKCKEGKVLKYGVW